MNHCIYVPPADDPHDVFALSFLTSPPRVAYDEDDKVWRPLLPESCTRRHQGLPLVWDGKPIPEAFDRALRCLARRENPKYDGLYLPKLVESRNDDCFVLWDVAAGPFYYGKNTTRLYGFANNVPQVTWPADAPAPGPLREALALASVCVARLGGSMEVA